MGSLATIDDAHLASGRTEWMDDDDIERIAAHPAACVETEFPHMGYTASDVDDWRRPAHHHPIFYGCFDWHSAVHSHWCLIRLLRLFDAFPSRETIIAGIDARFSDDGVAGEVAFFDEQPTFERPYGWGWLLYLIAELERWDDPIAKRWLTTLGPLERRIVDLVEEQFLPQTWPLRVGTHTNSAFGLVCVLDYARVVGNDDLEAAVVDVATDYYLDDHEWPLAYEPLGWDFLSPGLVEADLMRRVLDRDAFARWFDTAFADLAAEDLRPVTIPGDGGYELHLVGLNLSRAWCLYGIANTLGDRPKLTANAARHATAGLERAFDDVYEGSHWLSSYAFYLLSRNEGVIDPSRG